MNFKWRLLEDRDIVLMNRLHNELISSDMNNNITKYITSKDVLLGDTLSKFCLEDHPVSEARVAYLDGQLIGIVMYTICHLDDEVILELEAIIVHPHLTGKGYGKKMLEDMIYANSTIFNEDITHIQAIVDKSNIPSQKIFNKNNFIKKLRIEPSLTDSQYFEYDLNIKS